MAREAKNRNARERAESLLQFPVGEQLKDFARRLQELDSLPEDTIEQVRAKTEAYGRIESSPDFQRLCSACNIWTAAFFQNFSNGSAGPVTTDALRTMASMGRLPDARLAGWIEATAEERRFFHWSLAFPEVFASGGFDVFLGNPPFMGGLKISTNFGDKYWEFLTQQFGPFSSTADLCAAFFRRAFSAVKEQGAFALIGTNTIGQGDTRTAGLAEIKRSGGIITFAHRFVKWPGRANVEVNLVAVGKARNEKSNLDGQTVAEISSRLDADAESEPQKLKQNDRKSFIGSYVLGMGFVMEPKEAEQLISTHTRNRDCLFPYLNGEDVNHEIRQQPTRWVINFFDWPIERAEKYTQLFRIITEQVKPERDKVKRDRNRLRWWIYAENRPGLYSAISRLRRVLVRCRVSELHMMVLVPNGWVYSDATVVFAFDDYFHFALLQSNLHEAWVWKNASSLESRNRYTPTDCFETFAFPQEPSPTARVEAERLGEEYHEHRAQTMLARQLGLTKTYNLLHKLECTDTDITRLRELHAAMDRKILACYGWTDIDPGHGFHQNDRGQGRYTVSPTARREILRRLLALNLGIAAREATVETPRRRRG